MRTRARLKKPLEERRILSAKNPLFNISHRIYYQANRKWRLHAFQIIFGIPATRQITFGRYLRSSPWIYDRSPWKYWYKCRILRWGGTNTSPPCRINCTKLRARTMGRYWTLYIGYNRCNSDASRDETPTSTGKTRCLTLISEVEFDISYSLYKS